MGLKKFVEDRVELKKWKIFFDAQDVAYGESYTLQNFSDRLNKELQNSSDSKQASLIAELKNPSIQNLVNSSILTNGSFNRFLDDI